MTTNFIQPKALLELMDPSMSKKIYGKKCVFIKVNIFQK